MTSNSNRQRLVIFHQFRHFRHCMHFWTSNLNILPHFASPLVIFAKIANFAKIAIFAKIASFQGATFGIQFKSPEAGDFSPVSPLHAFLDIQFEYFATYRQPSVSPFSPLHAFLDIQFEYFATFRQPSGDFCQNRHFRQNRQPPRGHFWRPVQIASDWRFFASFAIFAIACISGHNCDLWNTSLQLFDLNYKFELVGASLLALAKPIY